MQDVQRELVTHAKCMRGDSMLVRPVLRCVRGVYAGVEVGAKDVVHAMHVARPSMHHAVLESVPLIRDFDAVHVHWKCYAPFPHCPLSDGCVMHCCRTLPPRIAYDNYFRSASGVGAVTVRAFCRVS